MTRHMLTGLVLVVIGLTASAARSQDPAAAATPAPIPMQAPTAPDLMTTIQTYQQRFGTGDPFRKITNDRGRGPNGVIGLRNLRAVLPGVLYRAGANNAYRTPPLESGPLPPEGLTTLCEQGFSEAIYLYNTGYVAKTVDCVSGGRPNTLTYAKMTPHDGDAIATRLLRKIHAQIEGQDHRPILVHCWNGWHASGYVSALALRQFCGISGDDAVSYWDTTGAPASAKRTAEMHAKLRGFTPLPDLALSPANKAMLCSPAPKPS